MYHEGVVGLGVEVEVGVTLAMMGDSRGERAICLGPRRGDPASLFSQWGGAGGVGATPGVTGSAKPPG